MNPGLFLLLGLIAAAVLAFALPWDATIGGMEAGAVVANSAYALIALAMLASVIHRYQGRLGQGLRHALIWAGLFVALVAGYAYRDLLSPIAQRVTSEFNPGAVVTPVPGIAEIARRRDGHFLVNMQANGANLSFVFDTGASSVVLRAEDVGKIGIDASKLDYSRPISTANGSSRAAEITLERLSVGSITQTRVRALVARPGSLNENLLGMSFLEKLAFYGVENNRLVLRSK